MKAWIKGFFLFSLSFLISAHAATHLDIVQVGHWPAEGQSQNCAGMAVRGKYLFAMVSRILQTVDISNPTTPIAVASIGSGGWDVKLSGNYAFCSVEDGLQVVNISDPLAPQPIIHLTTGHLGEHIELNGSTAKVYLRGGGVDIFDISNPAQPALIDSDTTASWSRAWTVSNGYSFSDNQVFQTSSGRLAATVPNIDLGSHFVSGLAVSWPYLYTAVWGLGVNIYEIREALPPMRLNPATISLGNANHMQLAGDYLYFIDSWRFGAIDIHDPNAPVGLGYYTPYSAKISYQTLLVSGNYAYAEYDLPLGPYFGLYVFDITDPTKLTLLGQITSPTGVFGGEILALVNGYLYLRSGVIFDVRNPAAPAFLTAPALTDIDWNSIAAGKPYLKVSDRLIVYGLGSTNPPQFLKPGGRIAMSGDYAFTTGPSGVSTGVSIIDLIHGGSEVATFATSRHVWDISILGKYAYLATDLDGVEVFELSNSTNAVRVGGLSSFSARSLQTRDDFVYAIGSELEILHRFDFPDVFLKFAAPGDPHLPRLRVFGPPGLTGRLQKAPTLTSSWADWTNLAFTANPIDLDTPAAPGNSQFFRFISP